MDIHKNARLSFRSREALARLVVEQRATRKAAAAAFRVSAKTAGKWVERFRLSGIEGLLDRSSRPHRSPRRLAESLSGRVVELRRGHMPGYEIARRTGTSPASVSRILRRARLSRWRDLNPPPIQRYEHPMPGDLVHLDIKGMTRFSEVSLRGDGRLRGKQTHPGFLALHVAVDDHSRMAFTQMLPDQKADTTIGFLRSAVEFFALSASAFEHCSPTTARATAQASSATHACRCSSNIDAQDPTRPEPTGRRNASSRPPCANGPTQITGKTPMKGMPTCSRGTTTTTIKDPMVASTTSRPSAVPTVEQRLDRLQAPCVQSRKSRQSDVSS
jgi:transposase